MPARDGYSRAVIWLSKQGYVVDVGGRDAVAAATPTEDQQMFNASDGTARLRRRTNNFELGVVKGPLRDHIRQMSRLGCTARMVAFSPGGAHQFWYEGSRIQMADRRGGSLSFAGGRVSLENRIYSPAIWQSANLLDGIPWHCSETLLNDDGDNVLTHPTMVGYEGPWWEGGTADLVTCAGVATIASQLTLQIEMPVQGAVLKLTDCTGTIEALDWHGNQLDSAAAGAEFTIPEFTWYINLTVTAASDQPALEVVKAGDAVAPRIGGWNGDCATRVVNPAWTPAPPAAEVTAPLLSGGGSVFQPTVAAGIPPVQPPLLSGGGSVFAPEVTAATKQIDTAWTDRTASAGHDWWDVVWAEGLGLFVAVAGNGAGSGVMTSPDGITWTTRTCPNEQWRSITWSESLGLLVAACRDNTTNCIMTSTDGITWTQRTTPAGFGSSSIILRGVWVKWCPNVSLFVACMDAGSSGTGHEYVMTSPDGTTWTARATPDDHGLFAGVAYSDSLGQVIVTSRGDVEDNTIVSSDGITWSAGSGSAADVGCRDPYRSDAEGFYLAGDTSSSNQFQMKSANGQGFGDISAQGYSMTPAAQIWSPEAEEWLNVGTKSGKAPSGANTWTEITITGTNWTGMAYSPSLERFCAVGLSGAVATIDLV